MAAVQLAHSLDTDPNWSGNFLLTDTITFDRFVTKDIHVFPMRDMSRVEVKINDDDVPGLDGSVDNASERLIVEAYKRRRLAFLHAQTSQMEDHLIEELGKQPLPLPAYVKKSCGNDMFCLTYYHKLLVENDEQKNADGPTSVN